MISSIKILIKDSRIFHRYVEYKIRREEIHRFLAEAKSQITPPDLIISYSRDLHRYMFNFDEWMNMYALKDATDQEKQNYISRSRAQKFYRKLVKPEVRSDFYDKAKFLNLNKDLIRRKFLIVTDTTTAYDVKEILSAGDVIVKPTEGSLGNGIFKITKEKLETIDIDRLLEQCKRDRCIIEECVNGCDELQRFHPQSLNTIRVMTCFDGKDSAQVFGSFIRFGKGGSVVDNAHHGGIFCTVDVRNGRICTDGLDTNGNSYEIHPDTGLKFKDFEIPLWDKISEKCGNAHKRHRLPFVGWDVCVTNTGDIEIIEGNHAPDMDIIQGPVKKGCAKEFEEICRTFERNTQTTK